MSTQIQTLQNYKNDTISTPSGINSSDTSWSHAGSAFGSPSFKVWLTIDPDLSTKEIVRVTVAGSNVTQAERGKGGTSAQSHSVNAVVRMTQPAELWNITADLLETAWTTVPDYLALAYVSTTSFTVAGDWTAIFSKGDKLRLTNGSTKYGYVTGAAYSTGLTTVTFNGGSDYVLAPGAVTALSYSKMAFPSGFPTGFSFTVAATGFASKAVDTMRFQIISGWVLATINVIGVSNSGSFTFGLPVAPKTTIDAGPHRINDNSTLSFNGMLSLVAASLTCAVSTSPGGAGWTAVNNKALTTNLMYEMN